jgi:hypothetical protein
VSSASDAEVLLRWLQLPREQTTAGVDLDCLSEPQLERLHAGLVQLASMDATVLSALVEQVLEGEEPVSSG